MDKISTEQSPTIEAFGHGDFRFDIVSRLPFEVSAAILEEVARTSDGDWTLISGSTSNEVKTAARSRLGISCMISRVCQKWRNLALNIPFLWSKIKISVLQRKVNRANELLTATSHRIGAYPAEIVVDDFRAYDPNGEKIEVAVDQCHLERIENIKHLHIRFLADYELNSDVFLKLLGQVMRPPEMLTLDCGRAVPGASGAFSAPWCLNKIMKLSPTTSHLYLRFVGARLELRDEDSWSSITTLEIEKPDHPFPLPKLVNAIPNLQRLIIRRNSREPHPHAYEWSSFPPHNRITYLQVPDLSFVGWHLTPYRGMFPALTELDTSSDELLRIFLEKHPQVPYVRVKGIGYSTSDLNWRDGDRLDDETSFGREQ